jgi:hypothetical protein
MLWASSFFWKRGRLNAPPGREKVPAGFLNAGLKGFLNSAEIKTSAFK